MRQWFRRMLCRYWYREHRVDPKLSWADGRIVHFVCSRCGEKQSA